MGIHLKYGSFTFSGIERKSPALISALPSNKSSLCSLHRSRDLGREGPNDLIVSIKREADGRRLRRRKIIDEKNRAMNGSLRNTSTGSKEATFVI